MSAASHLEPLPPAKRLRVDAPAPLADPLHIVTLNLGGLKGRMLAEVADRGNPTATELATSHAHALVAYLFRDGPPDVLSFSELHLRARSAQHQGELEQIVVGCGKADLAEAAQAASAAQAVETLMSAPELAGYKLLLSLHSTKRGKSGICALLRPGLKPVSVSYSLVLGEAGHHEEGRVILLEFATTRLLLTYSPNNGKNAESIRRRKLWDEAVLVLLSATHAKPLIWGGDLNVAPSAMDWRGNVPKDLAGTTEAEQSRFKRLLAAGRLRDAWRSLHPGEKEGGWTWRGHTWLSGCAMRLDHFCVNESLWGRVLSCQPASQRLPTTRGPRNTAEPYFFGSDHWPLTLLLSPP
jgi:exodeoxyribonuclease-3